MEGRNKEMQTKIDEMSRQSQVQGLQRRGGIQSKGSGKGGRPKRWRSFFRVHERKTDASRTAKENESTSPWVSADKLLKGPKTCPGSSEMGQAGGIAGTYCSINDSQRKIGWWLQRQCRAIIRRGSAQWLFATRGKMKEGAIQRRQKESRNNENGVRWCSSMDRHLEPSHGLQERAKKYRVF